MSRPMREQVQEWIDMSFRITNSPKHACEVAQAYLAALDVIDEVRKWNCDNVNCSICKALRKFDEEQS